MRNTVIDPGDGWESLKLGDKLQPNDEYIFEGKWFPVESNFSRWTNQNCEAVRRRKVADIAGIWLNNNQMARLKDVLKWAANRREDAATVKTRALLDELFPLPPQAAKRYRLLVIGETIHPWEDESYQADSWYPAKPGVVTERHAPIRREIAIIDPFIGGPA